MSGGKRKFTIQTERVEINGTSHIVGARVATKPDIMWENPLRNYPLSSADDVARADAWISLYEAAVNGKPLNYGAENAKKDIELLMAIRDSASRGGIDIELPLSSMTEHEKKDPCGIPRDVWYRPTRAYTTAPKGAIHITGALTGVVVLRTNIIAAARLRRV